MVGHNERWSDDKLETFKADFDQHVRESKVNDEAMHAQIAALSESVASMDGRVKALTDILLQGKGVLLAGKVLATIGVATATFVGAAWTVWTFIVDHFHITQK